MTLFSGQNLPKQTSNSSSKYMFHEHSLRDPIVEKSTISKWNPMDTSMLQLVSLIISIENSDHIPMGCFLHDSFRSEISRY